MRKGDWTYAVYFSMDGSGWDSDKPPEKPGTVKQSLPQPAQLEYELYNIQSDPGQLTVTRPQSPFFGPLHAPAPLTLCSVGLAGLSP
jgi:hypothetical protein